MKTNQIIIWSIISMMLTSCFNHNYKMITHVNRDGSCRGEFHEIADSLNPTTSLYWNASGWEISQTDTLAEHYMSLKNRKNINVSKKFKSVEELSADTTRLWYCLIPKESLKKRFRWFYTYFAFTAVYPEVTNKGRVPMEKYLNKDEQKFYLQGDMSAYRGMNGFELKDVVDDIGDRFWGWYNRSLYEEYFDVIQQYADMDYRLQLPAMKDSLYSVHAKQLEDEFLMPDEICKWIDKFFATDHFSKLYAENRGEMNDILSERTKETDELIKYNIQYELTLPGKLITTNADWQNDETLVWKINMLKFLTDDYTLTAESRVVNVWAFVVTLLLIVFSAYCFLFESGCGRRQEKGGGKIS